jgi:hypothetical protein
MSVEIVASVFVYPCLHCALYLGLHTLQQQRSVDYTTLAKSLCCRFSLSSQQFE